MASPSRIHVNHLCLSIGDAAPRVCALPHRTDSDARLIQDFRITASMQLVHRPRTPPSDRCAYHRTLSGSPDEPAEVWCYSGVGLSLQALNVRSTEEPWIGGASIVTQSLRIWKSAQKE